MPSVLSEYRPAGHTSQAMPSMPYLPTGQLSQSSLAAFGMVPAAHAMQLICPSFAVYVPAGQATGALPHPASSTNVPAGAGSQTLLLGQSESVHVDASLYRPGVQAVQTMPSGPYVPAGQVVQPVAVGTAVVPRGQVLHTVAWCSSWYSPMAASQVSTAVAPLPATNVPSGAETQKG